MGCKLAFQVTERKREKEKTEAESWVRGAQMFLQTPSPASLLLLDVFLAHWRYFSFITMLIFPLRKEKLVFK